MQGRWNKFDLFCVRFCQRSWCGRVGIFGMLRLSWSDLGIVGFWIRDIESSCVSGCSWDISRARGILLKPCAICERSLVFDVRPMIIFFVDRIFFSADSHHPKHVIDRD